MRFLSSKASHQAISSYSSLAHFSHSFLLPHFSSFFTDFSLITRGISKEVAEIRLRKKSFLPAAVPFLHLRIKYQVKNISYLKKPKQNILSVHSIPLPYRRSHPSQCFYLPEQHPGKNGPVIFLSVEQKSWT